jgi:predicted dehydrogenase
LADAIQNGVKFPVSPQDAVDVMTIIELAARSSEEGIRLPFERIR